MTANEILDREGVIIEAVKEITGVLDIKTAPATATRDIIVPEEFIERQGTNVTRLNKRLREVSIGGRSYGVVAKPLSEIETELKSGYYTKRARGKQVKTPFNRQNAIAILRPDTIRSVAAGLGSKAVSECSFLPVELPADADYYFILPAMVNLAIGVDALLFDEKSELAGPLEALYKAVSGSEKTIDPSLLKDLFGRDAGCIERLISLFTVTLPRCRQLINDLPELRKMEDAISAAA
jgi:hypothetical protein